MTREDSLVDVKQLLGKYTLDEHIARADAYFRKLGLADGVCRKPWASIHEAPGLVSGLATVLHGLELFHGARVVDFGCGLGWLTMALADLGCEAIGVDASGSALALARELAARRFPPPPAPPRFEPFDGRRIPLEDASVDRIVTFDALHHVTEPAGVLAEMHRVLREGGIAAFHEPGPTHSLSPQSQAEMREFEVVENDIVIEELERLAKDAGFARMALAYQGRIPAFVTVDRFNALLAGTDPALATAISTSVREQNQNLRIFFLHKGVGGERDSRSTAGLAHRLSAAQFRSAANGRVLECHLWARNTGSATWLASATGRTGAVNVGVQLLEPDGRVLLRDYHRVHPFAAAVRAGEEVSVHLAIPLPNRDPGTFAFGIDLVSEGIAWFADLGSTPLRIVPRFGKDGA